VQCCSYCCRSSFYSLGRWLQHKRSQVQSSKFKKQATPAGLFADRPLLLVLLLLRCCAAASATVYCACAPVIYYRCLLAF
jgi:hypothetical protein